MLPFQLPRVKKHDLTPLAPLPLSALPPAPSDPLAHDLPAANSWNFSPAFANAFDSSSIGGITPMELTRVFGTV